MKEEVQRKPSWIRTKWQTTPEAKRVRELIAQHSLHTVCEESSCPNRGECYNRGTCTFLIMGSICTRGCRFCDVESGRPLPLDKDEPQKIADSINILSVRFAVITSVDRDDLPDYGSTHCANVISAIKRTNPKVGIEVLTPDFQRNHSAIKRVLDTNPDVFAHNLQTVRRMTPTVRDKRASYQGSLEVLQIAASINSTIPIKTGVMVGIGEKDDEVLETIQDAYNYGARSITIGQYLSPSRKHLHLQRFVTPVQFKEFEESARSIGFDHVASGPMVRSSYKAEELHGSRS